jgi:hypothetical protein
MVASEAPLKLDKNSYEQSVAVNPQRRDTAKLSYILPQALLKFFNAKVVFDPLFPVTVVVF